MLSFKFVVKAITMAVLLYVVECVVNFLPSGITLDRLCGRVVRVPGYTSGGLGLIAGATRLSEK
jgi:hypothetical protein